MITIKKFAPRVARALLLLSILCLLTSAYGQTNTATGVGALNSGSGWYNTADGWQALYTSGTGAAFNTAVGVDALYSNTTGWTNTAIGVYALSSNTTGGGNTAIGDDALSSNTTGYENTASGDTALGKNTTGIFNTASGLIALGGNTTGNENTASGDGALLSNTTGNFNTAMGYYAGPDPNSPNLTNANAIGAFATVSQSNSLALGGTAGSGWAVNVGIGTATPSAALDVVGSLKLEGSGNGITFPDGTRQTTATIQGPQGPPGPAVHSVAVCSQGGSVPSCQKVCAAAVIAQSVASQGQSCTATSDTGQCSITGVAGTCCVCAAR